MKLLDRIWSMLGLVDTEDAEEPQLSTDKPVVRPERKSERSPRVVEENKSRRTPQPEAVPAVPSLAPEIKANPAPAVPTDLDGGKGKVVIAQPTGFDDARQIAENLTNGKIVCVNFERTDGDTTKRTVDFMSGITYAVGGTVQRISSTIFLFAPSRVEVFSSERIPDEEISTLPWRRS